MRNLRSYSVLGIVSAFILASVFVPVAKNQQQDSPQEVTTIWDDRPVVESCAEMTVDEAEHSNLYIRCRGVCPITVDNDSTYDFDMGKCLRDIRIIREQLHRFVKDERCYYPGLIDELAYAIRSGASQDNAQEHFDLFYSDYKKWCEEKIAKDKS